MSLSLKSFSFCQRPLLFTLFFTAGAIENAHAAATLDLSDDAAFTSSSATTVDVQVNAGDGDDSDSEFKSSDWKKFIQEQLDHHSEKADTTFIGLYIGGPNPFEKDSLNVRFRPASTQKVFTAAAYVEAFGWNTKIPVMLKRSIGPIADDLLAPKLGGGVRSKGWQAIEDYSNQTIADAMKDDGLNFFDFDQHPVTAEDDYILNEIKINPYRVSCRGGSGFDGANDLLKHRDLPRSEVTVAALRYFLEGLKKKPYFEKILRSLPYAGIDGTLQRAAMAEGASRGTIAAKTGTLTGVKNLAGYVHVEKDGEDDYVPFVILTRTTSTSDAFSIDDTIVNKIAEVLHATEIPLTPFDYPRPRVGKKTVHHAKHKKK